MINQEKLPYITVNDKKAFHVTIDMDWAPDFAIRETLKILDSAGVKATFFVTHQTETLSEIEASGHELGIHPNFHNTSTQGNSVKEIVGKLLEIVPSSRLIRSHGLLTSTLILQEISSEYPQLKIDLSQINYKARKIICGDFIYEKANIKVLNFNWEDDLAFYDQSHDWSKFNFFSDEIIFNFHPIHIFLNSSSSKNYNALKSGLNGTSLSMVAEKVSLRHVSKEIGTRDYLLALLELKNNYQEISYFADNNRIRI